MERNLRLYLAYSFVFNLFAWLPVFFLFFTQHLSLPRVLQLEAIYYAAVVILEVPSGYFSDRVGRRPTLLISAFSFILAYCLFCVGHAFAVFAIAQVLLAAGIAFHSGTDTALHYDSLAALGREDEFGQREAKASRNGLIAGGLASLLGGLLGTISLRLAYLASLAASAITVILVWRLREPSKGPARTPGFLKQIADCLTLLKSRPLAWLFGFSILMFLLNHVPYEFYQPYLDLLRVEGKLMGGGTTLYAGFAMAGTMWIGAAVAANSIWLRNRLGIRSVLLLAALLQCLTIGSMSWVLHPAIFGLILMRSVPGALMRAPFNAAIAPRIAGSRHATFLSIQSLAGRGTFSLLLASLSLMFGDSGQPDWTTLSNILGFCALLGLSGLLLFASTAHFLRKPGGSR